MIPQKHTGFGEDVSPEFIIAEVPYLFAGKGLYQGAEREIIKNVWRRLE